MKRVISRREWISGSAGGAAALLLDRTWARAQVPDDARLARETLDFIIRCGCADGGYAPSPDPSYAGESDTKFSDLAAVTYAAVLAKTMGWELPRKERLDRVHSQASAARWPLREPRRQARSRERPGDSLQHHPGGRGLAGTGREARDRSTPQH